MENKIYIGIDVCKKALDIAVRGTGEIWQEENNEEGIDQLKEKLIKLKPALIVMEATGGYEMEAALALGAADLPVAVINPRQARNFAKSTGKLAKTDKIDAKMLAHFGEAIKPEPQKMPDDEAIKLQATLSRRRQLVEMLVAEKNRRGAAHKSLKKQIEAHIEWLQRELSEVDEVLQAQIKNNEMWEAKGKVIRSVPGFGKVVTTTLLADLPEAGVVNRKKVAALAGVAPYNCDSGGKHGVRIIWGGRASIRNALYMATVSAIRFNPIIKEYYKKLIDNGKPPKVALVACMRKLLVIVNAMLRDMTLWDPELATKKTPIAT
jgi:transposase